MRLIDADKLPKYDGYALSADAVAQAVENAPTIETITTDEYVKVVGRITAHFEEEVKNYAPIRHGHWERGKDLFGMYYQCSECCSQYHVGYEFNYCPSCGAKMDAPTQKSVGKALKALDGDDT